MVEDLGDNIRRSEAEPFDRLAAGGFHVLEEDVLIVVLRVDPELDFQQLAAGDGFPLAQRDSRRAAVGLARVAPLAPIGELVVAAGEEGVRAGFAGRWSCRVCPGRSDHAEVAALHAELAPRRRNRLFG